MNPNQRQPVRGYIWVDRYLADPESTGLRWVHLYVVGDTTGRYTATITVGAGRGEGYGLPEIAQALTRQLEADFGLPAARTAWAVRLLSPPATTAESRLTLDGVARIENFRVVDFGDERLSVACPADRLLREHFHGVGLPDKLPAPPRSTASFQLIGQPPDLLHLTP